jgi:hypothetical protein
VEGEETHHATDRVEAGPGFGREGSVVLMSTRPTDQPITPDPRPSPEKTTDLRTGAPPQQDTDLEFLEPSTRAAAPGASASCTCRPGGRYFGCRRCYGLTYTSCQESHQDDRLARVLARNMGVDFAAARRALAQIG